MQCIGGLESYGRKRRSLRQKLSSIDNSTTTFKQDTEQDGENENKSKLEPNRYRHISVC